VRIVSSRLFEALAPLELRFRGLVAIAGSTLAPATYGSCLDWNLLPAACKCGLIGRDDLKRQRGSNSSAGRRCAAASALYRQNHPLQTGLRDGPYEPLGIRIQVR
jgi:hypothetical protein